MKATLYSPKDIDEQYLASEKRTDTFYGELVRNTQVKVTLVAVQPFQQQAVEFFPVYGQFSGLTLTTYPRFNAGAKTRTRKYLKQFVRAIDRRGQFLVHRAVIAVEIERKLPDGRSYHVHHINHWTSDMRAINLVIVPRSAHYSYHAMFASRGPGTDLFTQAECPGPGEIIGWIVFDWRVGAPKEVQNKVRAWITRLQSVVPGLIKKRAKWLAKILMFLESAVDQTAALSAILDRLQSDRTTRKLRRRTVEEGLLTLVSWQFITRTMHGYYTLKADPAPLEK